MHLCENLQAGAWGPLYMKTQPSLDLASLCFNNHSQPLGKALASGTKDVRRQASPFSAASGSHRREKARLEFARGLADKVKAKNCFSFYIHGSRKIERLTFTGPVCVLGRWQADTSIANIIVFTTYDLIIHPFTGGIV